ncbi:hypothetical protein HHL19_03465 [Streptomyces sp. R302]|uniref:hypothetical protein n=1 Tax=unclassified Streptomyces TaxID=2593676 RepID=UPI00145E25CD|nr:MULTISPECIES: hypothetical protein [unclassified Streptomyces]NML49407.1 hypothetical protein [Streptomyces sp. R301]NML77734.1 hypothetical protein [Streptomyces sp. R302]
MPLHAVPHFVGHMHGQGLGGVVLEVTGVFEVPVRTALQALSGQAQALAYGLRSLLAPLVEGGPVRIDLGAGVALDGRLTNHIAPNSFSSRARSAGSVTASGSTITDTIPSSGLAHFGALFLPRNFRPWAACITVTPLPSNA